MFHNISTYKATGKKAKVNIYIGIYIKNTRPLDSLLFKKRILLYFLNIYVFIFNLLILMTFGIHVPKGLLKIKT